MTDSIQNMRVEFHYYLIWGNLVSSSEQKIINKQAEQILYLQRKITKLESALSGYGAITKTSKSEEVTKLEEKNKKRNKLPGWVRHMTD